MKIKTKHVIIVFSLLIIIIFSGGWYLGRINGKNASKPDINALKGQITSMTLLLNEKTIYLSVAEQELASQKELVRQKEIEKKLLSKTNIKKVNEVTKLKLQVDTLLANVEYNKKLIKVQSDQVDSLIYLSPTGDPALLLPFDIQRKDNWLDMKISLDEEGDASISLKVPVNIDLITGFEKKTKKPVVTLSTDNPYIKPLSIRSYKLDMPKQKRVSLGIMVGYGIMLGNPMKSAPLVGAGLTYNLINF